MDTENLHGFKILHLVRHAQGVHNAAAEENLEALMSEDLIDAPLSPLGWQQVYGLKKLVYEHDMISRIELVITSPMSRTIQTAIGVFGSTGVENEVATEFSSIPTLAVELCRERLGVQPCNKRRSISKYKSLFPAVDFSLIESEDDNMWTTDYRETHEEVAARGMKFLEWLWTRKETEIAIVSHGVFLQDTLKALGKKSVNSLIQIDTIKRFQNCELRSVIINADESFMNSKSCGGIQYSLQFQSNGAEENGSDKEKTPQSVVFE